MKTKFSVLTAMALSLALSAPVFANDEHHPEKTAAGQSAVPAKPAPVAATPAPVAAKSSGIAIKTLQNNVAKQQKQLQKIAKAKTGDERQQLMADLMKTMHENMMMAKGMMDGMESCPMMDGMMSSKGGMGMMGTDKPVSGADDRMNRMEKRMDMMERMMKDGGSSGMSPGMVKP